MSMLRHRFSNERWLQNSIDQAVSLNKCFIVYRTTAKSYVICRNTAKVVKLKVHILQLLNVYKSQHNVTPTRHETKLMSRDKSVDLTGVLSCRATFDCLRQNVLKQKLQTINY